MDLDSAIEIARAVYRRGGLGVCELDELAAELKLVMSGTFRQKTGTARIFEVIEKDGRSGVRLTDLGEKIVHSETEKSAKAEAFLRVPLYMRIFDKYKGKLLPPPKALEREMQTFGVSSKQTDKARQAFERSARQAGFFEMGEDRLIRPKVEDLERGSAPQETEDRRPETIGEQGSTGSPRNLGKAMDGAIRHPFIEGLLRTLPDPDTDWPTRERIKWLKTAANMFELIYRGGTGDIDIKHVNDE
jgi:hypothetical protein